MKLRTTISVLACGWFAGCATAPSPGISLRDAHVVEGPVLIDRSEHVYLRYRRGLNESGLTLTTLLGHRKTTDAIYYFFSTPISHPEWGSLVERPLAYDGAEGFARAGRVFWLDPDGSVYRIPLKREMPNQSSQATAAPPLAFNRSR